MDRIRAIPADPAGEDAQTRPLRALPLPREEDDLVSSAEGSFEPLASDVAQSSQYSTLEQQDVSRSGMKLSTWAPDESVERIRAQNRAYLESASGSEGRRSHLYQSYLPLHLRSTYGDVSQNQSSDQN